MIQIENLSYEFPSKELYKNISFTLEEGQHCAMIGSNGTGKTTLAEMIMEPEKYLYDGKITKSEECRIGYVDQFSGSCKQQEKNVFDFLSERFLEIQNQIALVCEEMAAAEDLDSVFVRYQNLLDLFQAMDGENYESNIRKQLYLAGMTEKESVAISNLSGGEYKLLQMIKEMLQKPELLIMDEPDVFLDFSNMDRLRRLINAYPGTLLVITHNRYLLNHCFDKILHLENADVQEFDGNYTEYHLALLQKKIELQELAAADQEEIERTEKMVDRMRKNASRADIASLGRTLHAKVTHLERLRSRAVKAPFVEIRMPKITLPVWEENGEEETVLLQVSGYRAAFDEVLLEDVNLEVKAGEKIAIVGANGTGKTTLLRDILYHSSENIRFHENARIGFLSQLHGDTLKEENTIYEEMEALGFQTKAQIREYLKDYCFSAETLTQKIAQLSGGEQNLLQLAKLSCSDANLLLLDEPTSHLDLYSQIALEQALAKYQGAVLMVAHDFYHVVNTADWVYFVENKTLRKMRMRSFRKRMYETYFSKEYLEFEQKKKELETRIASCLRENDLPAAKELYTKLEDLQI